MAHISGSFSFPWSKQFSLLLEFLLAGAVSGLRLWWVTGHTPNGERRTLSSARRWSRKRESSSKIGESYTDLVRAHKKNSFESLTPVRIFTQILTTSRPRSDLMLPHSRHGYASNWSFGKTSKKIPGNSHRLPYGGPCGSF